MNLRFCKSNKTNGKIINYSKHEKNKLKEEIENDIDFNLKIIMIYLLN
jgi:hypothetical protein